MKRTYYSGGYYPNAKIDEKNGNTLWQEEMDTVTTAFRIVEEGETIPPGYQEIDCHLVFTVKMKKKRVTLPEDTRPMRLRH